MSWSFGIGEIEKPEDKKEYLEDVRYKVMFD